MKNKYLVSIIVGVYNGEKYLRECINSIQNQTYDNLEIILVDDGATDSSGKICDDYAKKDSRIKVIHKKNGGVSSARNSALRIINGDFVCIVDQDDLLECNYVEYLLNLIIDNNADVSVVPQVIYYTNEKKIYEEKHDCNLVEIWTGETAACEMLYSKMEIGPWSKMISHKLIMDNNIQFNENYFGGEGYLFSVESFVCSKRVAVGYKGVYNYRVDNYSSEMSKFKIRTFNSSLNAVSEMIERFSNKSKKLNRATKYAYWRVYVSFLNSMIGSESQKLYPEVYKNFKHNCRKYAYLSFTANVPFKRKIKDLLYFISPCLVANINVRRNKKRKMGKE